MKLKISKSWIDQCFYPWVRIIYNIRSQQLPREKIECPGKTRRNFKWTYDKNITFHIHFFIYFLLHSFFFFISFHSIFQLHHHVYTVWHILQRKNQWNFLNYTKYNNNHSELNEKSVFIEKSEVRGREKTC